MNTFPFELVIPENEIINFKEALILLFAAF